MKKLAKKTKRRRTARAKSRSGEAILNREWQECWGAMQRIIRKSFPDQYEFGKDDSEETAWIADLIAQSYFIALQKAVPDEPEKPVLWGIPLNVSERILLFHIQRLNEVLCQLARAERWHACQELWDQAVKLVSTFSEVSLKYPDPFKSKARQSLSMPSLRVPPTVRKSKKGRAKWTDPFLGNSPKISEAIELSADTVGAKISDNRGQLGGMCAHLVGECVQEIKRARALWAHFFTPYGQEVRWPTREQIEPFRDKTHDELIAGIKQPRPTEPNEKMQSYVRSFCLLGECGVERLHFLLLNDLTREEAGRWWKNAIEKMIERRFPALLQQRIWVDELKAVSSGTSADMRKELKDYCRDKVKQFA